MVRISILLFYPTIYCLFAKFIIVYLCYLFIMFFICLFVYLLMFIYIYKLQVVYNQGRVMEQLFCLLSISFFYTWYLIIFS